MWHDCLNTHEGSCALAGSCYRRTGRDPGEKDSSVHRVSFHSQSSAFTGQTQQASRRTNSTQLFCCSFTAWLIITRPSNSDARRSEAVTALTMMMTTTRRMMLNGVLPLNSRVSWWGLKIGFRRLNEDIWGGEIKVTPKFLSAEFSGVGYQMFNSLPP